MSARIELADAREWLAAQTPSSARCLIYDPPYSVSTLLRGREDGAAGSVFGPLSFLFRTMSLSARAVTPGGIVIIFGDWRRMPDLGDAACMVGLRPAAMVAWVRTRPGTGGLFRASWDPIMIAARGVPKAVDRAAIRNVVITEGSFGGEDFTDADLVGEDFSGEDVPAVVEADYERPRRHPYSKPPAVYEHILRRVVRRGDTVLDPFAGSGSSRTACGNLDMGLRRSRCDIDPAYAETGPEGEPL
jgi:site-specific DNA-methyltransferase (adenine-specific)